MLLILFAVWAQDLSLANTVDWATAARPWMTRAEAALYDQLPPEDQLLFRGTFLARRQDNPNQWPVTGAYAPGFFPPRTHGDIRDQIAFAFQGLTPEILPQPANPELPRAWRFGDTQFDFIPKTGGGVQLAPSGQDAWERVVSARVVHPEIRYDFRAEGFGRTRFPEEKKWSPTRLLDTRQRPHSRGATVHFTVELPAEFGRGLQATISPIQQLELLILLKQRPDEDIWQLEAANRLRHASVRTHLVTTREAVFEAELPPGNFDTVLFLYSGFLTSGLRAETNLHVLPTDLPRIGDPIVARRMSDAGLIQPEPHLILINDQVYQPMAGAPQLTEPAFVLLPQFNGDVTLTLQSAAGNTVLSPMIRDTSWTVYKLPPQTKPYRLLAAGSPSPTTPLLALAARGDFLPGNPLENPPTLAGTDAYLKLETLEFQSKTPATTHLFVNGTPLVGSTNGIFPWPGMDWGATAQLRFEAQTDQGLRTASYQAQRGGVFENIQVRPKYLVAGVRSNQGFPVEDKVKVLQNNRQVRIVSQTPLRDIPQLWGIMVNDPLLKAPTWPKIREAIFTWLKDNTGEADMIYVVHNAHRPRLILPPTTHKSKARAALFALAPTTRNENYFTVRYLLDALTHLKQHQTRPHQVFLLTNQLTGEVQQMEDLLTIFRQTGLQLYNLEFPFTYDPESETKSIVDEPDPLVTMAVREENDQRDRLGVRDNFLERHNVTAGWTVTLGKTRNKRQRLDDAIRATAYRDGFNDRLAYLTAGLAATDGMGETVQGLQRFLTHLTTWQRLLVHLELAESHLDEEQLRVIPENTENNAAWTLVEWRP